MNSNILPFLITIDTEGDSQWARQQKITTRNAGYLPRFQALCEKFGFKPTYLTNYEMAMDDEFVAFAREKQRDGKAEVGMHLHAWYSPPHVPALTADDFQFHPYLIEFPDAVLREKVARMTEILTEKFGRRPTSHRAGRWALDSRYAAALIDHGYLVDCSVTPHVSWRSNAGSPEGSGGSDYRRFPDSAYFVDTEHINRPGSSRLLEIPMTVIPRFPLMTGLISSRLELAPFPSKILNRLLPIDWFRPNQKNASQMMCLPDKVRNQKREYIQFMIHSSELMPGGSPYFPSEGSIEKLYEVLDKVFEKAANNFGGMTLTEFYHARLAR